MKQYSLDENKIRRAASHIRLLLASSTRLNLFREVSQMQPMPFDADQPLAYASFSLAFQLSNLVGLFLKEQFACKPNCQYLQLLLKGPAPLLGILPYWRGPAPLLGISPYWRTMFAFIGSFPMRFHKGSISIGNGQGAADQDAHEEQRGPGAPFHEFEWAVEISK